MRGAEQRPLAVTGGLASSHQPVTATGTLARSEHRLHGLASPLVQATTTFRQPRPLHPLSLTQSLRDAPPWTRLLPQHLPLLPVLVRGHQQLQPCRSRLRQGGLAARAGIGQGDRDGLRMREGPQMRLRLVQHRVQWRNVMGLLRHLGRHDARSLRHHRLGVVAVHVPGHASA